MTAWVRRFYQEAQFVNHTVSDCCIASVCFAGYITSFDFSWRDLQYCLADLLTGKLQLIFLLSQNSEYLIENL